ncbi:MAG: amidohydrolase [Clostridia bacterium]|nr:amidohydrolase [Clostridia bacterium]
MEKKTLIIRNAAHLIKDCENTLSNVDIKIANGFITEIGKDLCAPDAREIDASSCIVAPGFHNLHTHLYQNFLKGMKDYLPLVEWCEQVTFPFVTVALGGEVDKAELFYSFAMMGGIEQLKSGITAFVDLDMSHPAMNKAWQELGIRGNLAVQSANAWIPEHLRANGDAAQIKSLLKYFEGAAPYTLTSTAIGPSTPFCCTQEYLKALTDIGRETGRHVQIHVSETEREVKEALEDYGMTPLEYLDSLGVLGSNMSIVHCVHLTDKEMQITADRGLVAVHCPMSNLKLADGLAPIKKLRSYGIPVTLGTDGAASNDRLDMFAEMRCALQLARLRDNDAAALTAKDAFDMATRVGAEAMGLKSGVIEVGRPADIILVDTFAPNMMPCHDPINTLVWCAAPENVRTVVVNGDVVLENGQPTRVDAVAQMKEALRLEGQCRALVAAQEQ